MSANDPGIKYFRDAKIVFVTPMSLDTTYKAFHAAMLNLKRPTDLRVMIDNTLPVSAMRNRSIQSALNEGAEYIMFMDHDNIPDPMTVARLWSQNLPIVGQLYFERDYPHLPLIYTMSESGMELSPVFYYPKAPLVRCDGLGMGCCLIKTDVFRAIPSPWFEYTYKGHVYGSEDVCFFVKLKEAGIPLYIDTEHTVGHLKVYEVNERDWEANREGYLMETFKKQEAKRGEEKQEAPASPEA
jgi:hypothetical protein